MALAAPNAPRPGDPERRPVTVTMTWQDHDQTEVAVTIVDHETGRVLSRVLEGPAPIGSFGWQAFDDLVRSV